MKAAWVLLTGLLLAPFALAQSDSFPSRPIKIIVPFTPGAGSDISARFFGTKLGALLGQTVVVENKPGALGAIGASAAKSAPADGYTILLGSNSPMTVNPVMVANLPYDPIKDFKPISGLARNTNVFIVPAGSRFRTLGDLVAAAKSERKLNVGTAASGYEIVMEWFAAVAGVKFNNIPYKGGSQVYNDVAAGILDWAVAELAGAATLIASGRVRALATTGDNRHPRFPDVPTVKESGYPEFVTYSWNALYVRSETPDEVALKLANAMQIVLATEESANFVKGVGTELLLLPPTAMRKFQIDEYERFKGIAARAGLKPQ